MPKLTDLALRVLRRSPTLYGSARSTYERVGELRRLRQFPDVPGRIHPNDLMIGGRSPALLSEYVAVGKQAAEWIFDALGELGQDPSSARILDLGAGFGRVTRHLVTRTPPQRVMITDLDPIAVKFCV